MEWGGREIPAGNASWFFVLAKVLQPVVRTFFV
jgi:hypothetical protein